MHPLLKQAGKNEERARTDSMADHLDHGALERYFISREDAEQHESHVADAGVGDEAFEIGLGDRKYRAVKNSDDADCHHEGSHLARWTWKERQHETDEPVRTRLQQKSGQDNATGGGSFGVCIREPGVKRESGEVYRKTDKKYKHQEACCAGRQRCIQQLFLVEGEDTGRALMKNGERK